MSDWTVGLKLTYINERPDTYHNNNSFFGVNDKDSINRIRKHFENIPEDYTKPFFSDSNNEGGYILKVKSNYLDNTNLKRGKTYHAEVSFRNYQFQKGGIETRGVYVDDVVIKKYGK
jgi:hypothetical protein